MPPEDQNAREDRSAGRDAIAAIAVRWVARRDDGLTVDERRELRGWIAQAPEHAAAFSAADAARTELDWPLHTGTIDTILTQLDERARNRRRRRRTLASAATVAGLLLVVGLFHRIAPREIAQPIPKASTLVVLAPQNRVLSDGSRVELSDGAQISVAFDANTRVITLLRGAAHFEVTKDGRPFIVRAAGVSARALGTVFAVERDPHAVSVVVTEGHVAVDRTADAAGASALPTTTVSAEPLTVLSAGKSVSVPIAQEAPASPPDVTALSDTEIRQKLSWRVPRLEFNGTPLAEVVAMVNRYNREQFVITDAALERLAVSGILRADKVDALVEMLESDFHLRVDRRDLRLILSRPE
jgi:transmembrane sensor